MVQSLDYRQVARALADAQRLCIITHVRPDADAIGSAAALSMGLRQLGKETVAVIGQRRPLSANIMTIPGAEDICLVEQLPDGYDLYVTVDCGSVERTGAGAPQIRELAAQGLVLCIDHHASNPGFGSINLVDADCESTTVVLSRVLQELSVQITRPIAHALYAGLVSDTGSFRWGRPAMHDLAARLMSYGVDIQQVAVDLLDATTADDLTMVGRVLAGLRLHQAGEIRMGILVGALSDIAGHSDAAVESLVDHVRAVVGTDMGVVFKEQEPQVWAVSLRSATVNCAQIAVSLGGGGHIPAAGYTTYGTVEQVIDQLSDAVIAQQG